MAHPQYKSNANLSEILLEKLEDPELPEIYTVDDFFDDVGVPKEQRSDFAFTAILNGVEELRKQEKK